MKALITGANGTIGKELKRYLEFHGVEVYTWNRKEISIFEYQIMEDFVQKLNPDIVYHLAIATKLDGVDNETWRVNYEWPSELAWICRIHQIKFVFTSTYEVFSDYNVGPFDLNTKPDAFEGFGFEKRMAEERVLYQNPQALVVRLPWQITNNSNSNGMVYYLDKEMAEYEKIILSDKFIPSCAFLDDTVEELVRISKEHDRGKFMVDSNKNLSFFEIASKLKVIYSKNWKIEKSDDYEYNQTMDDIRCQINPLNEILEEKLNEIKVKSRKKIGLWGNEYLDEIIRAYEKLGYKIDTLVIENPDKYRSFAKEHGINTLTDDTNELYTCTQIIINNREYITEENLNLFKDKILVLSQLPFVEDLEAYEKYYELFKDKNHFIIFKFNQLITMRKVFEQIKENNLGKITNLFLDIGVKNNLDIKKNFQEIILKPISFISNHFDKFHLDYSDYNNSFETVFTHHCNGNQRMSINFFKLWYEGVKMILRFIGDKGELRVEGKYTKESGWNFKPIQINELECGQGEVSKDGEKIMNLALNEYVKKLEEIIQQNMEHKDIYTAKEALLLYKPFLNIWNNSCKGNN